MAKLSCRKQAWFLFLVCATTAINLSAQAFTKLHNFDLTDGQIPDGTLVQGTDGYLYGTTAGGGVSGAGTVFKMAPNGDFTLLYNFCSVYANGFCTDGAGPFGGLVQSTDGNLYGTTNGGGPNGGGTVFKITSSGTLNTVYAFCSESNCTDGSEPFATLVQGIDGNF